jgi:uncharacterized protein
MPRQLSARTTLVHLTLDARRWLAALRRDDPTARARLATAWPGAPASPSLRDVQHALAREYGQRDWITLRAALADLALDREDHAQRVTAILRHGYDGDIARARRLVARDPSLRTASIFTAAATGDLEHVTTLLARQPQLATTRDPVRGWSPLLHLAYGRLDETHAPAIATLLLDAGADVHDAFDDGWGNPHTLITGVVGVGEQRRPPHPMAEALVALLLARGVSPFDTQAFYNTSLGGDDPHWLAVLWAESERRGVTSLWQDAVGHPIGGKVPMCAIDFLLGAAVPRRHLRRAEWLLAHGARAAGVHPYSGQSLHTEARLTGQSAMVHLLEAHGAPAESLDAGRGFLAAAMAGDVVAAREVLTAHPTLLRHHHPLLEAAGRGSAPAVALLLSLGVSVQERDAHGTTALHRAAEANAGDVIDVLLAASADVDARETRWGATPIGWARHLGQPDAFARLAVASHDIATLVRGGAVRRVASLLERDPTLANQRQPDPQAPTPLFGLPDDEDTALELADLLLVHGADPTVRSAAGATPADAATGRGLLAVAEVVRTAT